ncbi:MAG: cytochrome oxidase small assembly protein [Proteobacteria bacterium]|nr:cytochrome oxidase small assembly protein [Pseudomonadota bacterium]
MATNDSQPLATNDTQRKANVRLGLILATVAVVFALGFIAKIWLLGPH